MEHYIDVFAKRNPDRNDAYTWIMRDDIYIPIIRTYLSITKRTHFLLPLLDEIILRLVAEGVNEITEISNILGVERKLLEITIADLYKKNLVYCSSDKCNLRPPGIAALQKLQVIQRKKDTLRNVYYDPFNRRIFEDVKNIQFQDRVRDDDKKLNVDFDQDRISIFRENINSINKVFSDEMDIYNDKTKAEPDELLSVDRIENVFVKFIRIPVYVYVSNSGKDIDILSANKALMGLFNEFKNEIIEQVRQHKLLKRIFYSYKIQDDFAIPNVGTNDNIKKILTKRQHRNWDIGEREVFVEQEVLKTRKLFHDEFDLLLKFLCDDSSLITISISHFDEWHNNALLNSILSIVGGHRLKAFYYNTCKQVDRCIKSIERVIPNSKNKIQKKTHDDYLSILFEDKFILKGIPENVEVLEDETYIHKINYFLERIE